MRKSKLLALLVLGYWVFLILFALVDSQGIWGSDIGFTASLASSSLARVMFMDIGGLSTLVAIWILLGTKLKVRYLFALPTLFVGSFAALPYVAFWLWNIDNVSKEKLG